MYQFYGIVDRSSHRHDDVHLQSIATFRKKFPLSSASFNLLQPEGLLLLGSQVRSSRAGMTELFLIGEVYNEPELLPSSFNSGALTETLLDSYLKYGPSVFSKINGSFVILILDHDSGSCRIFNDQMGTLQVFYYACRDFILFASELKYLFCHPRCPRNIDWTASLKRPIPFLVVNAERHYDAWFKDIYLLEEGSMLESKPTEMYRVTKYWDPWQAATHHDNGMGHLTKDQQVELYCEEYMSLLHDAVRVRCSSKGSAFSMFSGGLDSTIIAALAHKHIDVETFSFATQATVRDGATEMCIRLAEDLGMSNTQIVIPFDELVTNGLLWTKHIWSMESPFAHKDAIGKTALHAAISGIQPNVKNIFSGTGSDQLNGGLVRWFVENADVDQIDTNWDRVMSEIRTEMLKPIIGHQYDTFWGSRDMLRNDYLSSVNSTHIQDYPWSDFVRGCLHANNFVLMWDELRAGARNQRGVQFPFMDHRFVPLVLNIPQELHSRLFFDKQILRKGARNVLPSFLTDRPKAPVIKPGEDRRMNMYKEILLGNNGYVLEVLLSSLENSECPVDRVKFETKVRHLVDQPDQAGWAYLMHLAGLIMLDQLPVQDENTMDMQSLIMPHVDVVSSASPSALSNIRKKLSVLSQEELLELPLCFSAQCSIVSDVFTNVHFLVRENEMCYQLDDECPDWCTFLRSIDGLRSAREICADEGLDLATFNDYLRISLDDNILFTQQPALHHA